MVDALGPLADAGVFALVLGGDHSIVLGELRALAVRHGPLALVQLDAHADTWDAYFGERYMHGTPFRRAVEEGILDPARSTQAGMRGSLYSRDDLRISDELGFRVIPSDELRALGPERFGDEVRSRAGNAPVFFSFDIDFVDPAVAPATGTPEVAGFSSVETIDFVRALTGLKLVGFDCVEVSPPYDPPGAPTALLAANVVYEVIALLALADERRSLGEGH
jgi:agmatinase